jgi:hypothetical protein
MKYKDFFINEDEQLKGGVGDATAPSTVNPAQLAMGVQIEMEHTNDEKIATEIALDHLTEDPEYYTKLVASGLAKEFKPQANSGFGDPKQSFNDKARLGTDVTCTPGNNIVGKIGTTPQGQVKDSEPVGPSKNVSVELDIDEPQLNEYIQIFREHLLSEKNVPTNKKLWARAKAAAKRKYKVYPSAYANGWAVKWYKKHGGSWYKSKKK